MIPYYVNFTPAQFKDIELDHLSQQDLADLAYFVWGVWSDSDELMAWRASEVMPRIKQAGLMTEDGGPVSMPAGWSRSLLCKFGIHRYRFIYEEASSNGKDCMVVKSCLRCHLAKIYWFGDRR